MTQKTFTLVINGYEYEVPYWTFPWIRRAFGMLHEGGVPLNLRIPETSDLWLHHGDDVEFIFDDPRDPEIPENLTYNEQIRLEDITEGDRRYGHRVLDVSDDKGNPIFWEWDDPKFR
ncbi:hypothetical protein [Corynebacterium wankanglinii]|uniref:Uncharacterized protein n=1 Tax=Corynebacterium wankanglinii TaxID=2735136 RepID=A0A838CF08_9CORY|nr:hypothetical protein [Corynebacterium wankanglinii]MBA1834136.1 hypothetical protein [Corynebacterium wankanglinii]